MEATQPQTLYDRDFALWVEATVAQLQAQDFAAVDLAHLIEEIDALGKRQRKTMRSYLVRLLEHLLKRRYVLMSDCYRGWEVEIRNFRQQLRLELADSPSLRGFILEILPQCYEMALETVRDSYPETDFPIIYPFADDVEALLTTKFWER